MGDLDESTPQQAQECLDSFHYAIKGVGTRMQLRKLRLLHRDTRWNECIATMYAFVDCYVDQDLGHLASQQSSALSEKKEEDGKRERYILLYKMAKHIEDKVELRHQILHVYLAGHDSTSITAANALFHLCRHPHIFQKLRTGVLAATGRFTFENLKSLRYLQYVVKGSTYHNPLN
jgi:hypothetical protein